MDFLLIAFGKALACYGPADFSDQPFVMSTETTHANYSRIEAACSSDFIYRSFIISTHK
jgi:hypothetical protein